MELRRSSEPAPTKPGWYYAQRHQRFFKDPFPVEPVLVVEIPEGMTVPVILTTTGDKVYAVAMSWYGPVPICVESGR